MTTISSGETNLPKDILDLIASALLISAIFFIYSQSNITMGETQMRFAFVTPLFCFSGNICGKWK